MAKGWLDNYGKQENYNDSNTSVPKGYEGEGYSMKGRNYSPAWGGSFQMGGSVYPVNYVPQAQNGLWKEDRKAFVDSTLHANKNLDFVKRLYDTNPKSIQIPGEPGRSTHFMANDATRVYPTVVNKNNKLQYLGGGHGDEAWDYADKTGEYINFKTPEQASWFANSPNHSTGYKLGTNVLTSVPKHQMGGSIPGAVGFTYARTQGAAPSKGPHRNKVDVTDASAQNGKEMSYYQNGLDFKPKSISKNGSWLSKYEDGGEVIESSRGQWDYPGEITRVPGGNITMKKDPRTGKALTEPLLGIADTGEQQMMYPGEDYNFEGANYVTEYPKGKKAQNGIRQEQKGLQNLDNLTNFTNYNKPQPGSWLEKYN